MFSLSAIWSLLEVESDTATGFTYNIREHGATEEDHMSPPGWIFDSDLEFLRSK